MLFLFEGVSSSSGAYDRLRNLIMALPVPSINQIESCNFYFLFHIDAVLTSTYTLCLRAKTRLIYEHSSRPQFYYVIVGFEGLRIGGLN